MVKRHERCEDIEEIIHKWDDIKEVLHKWNEVKATIIGFEKFRESIDLKFEKSMEELRMTVSKFTNAVKWMLGVTFMLVMFMMGIIYSLNAKSASHVTTQYLEKNYLSYPEFYQTWVNSEERNDAKWENFKALILSQKVDIADSAVVNQFLKVDEILDNLHKSNYRTTVKIKDIGRYREILNREK